MEKILAEIDRAIRWKRREATNHSLSERTIRDLNEQIIGLSIARQIVDGTWEWMEHENG